MSAHLNCPDGREDCVLDEVMYFQFCEACNCYEYDCHGIKGCIRNEPTYKHAHQRARERADHEPVPHRPTST